MRSMIIEQLQTHFQMFQELAELLPEAAYSQKLSKRSNTIGQQFWCVIGARESYTNGIIHNGWVDFTCSLPYEKTHEKEVVLVALTTAARDCSNSILDLEWTPEKEQLLLGLLEHEVQHQGQLIRYVYGLGYRFPESWVQHWALEQ